MMLCHRRRRRSPQMPTISYRLPRPVRQTQMVMSFMRQINVHVSMGKCYFIIFIYLYIPLFAKLTDQPKISKRPKCHEFASSNEQSYHQLLNFANFLHVLFHFNSSEDWLSTVSPGNSGAPASPGAQNPAFNANLSNGYSSPMSTGSYDPYSPNGKMGE